MLLLCIRVYLCLGVFLLCVLRVSVVKNESSTSNLANPKPKINSRLRFDSEKSADFAHESTALRPITLHNAPLMDERATMNIAQKGVRCEKDLCRWNVAGRRGDRMLEFEEVDRVERDRAAVARAGCVSARASAVYAVAGGGTAGDV